MKLWLADNSTILFQGDSITDFGKKSNYNESLGAGYAMLTAACLSASHPEHLIKFYNRGVRGDRIRDLRYRWKKDCLDLRPNLVSILIGINDVVDSSFWRRGLRRNLISILNEDNDYLLKSFWERSTSIESFNSDYTSILKQTQQSKCQIVLLEPFLINSSGKFFELTKELHKNIGVIRELAREFDATLIPLNNIFMNACLKRGPSFWSLDGVHPTLAGHALIAQSWIKGVIGQQ